MLEGALGGRRIVRSPSGDLDEAESCRLVLTIEEYEIIGSTYSDIT